MEILLNYISLEDDMTYKFNIYILSKDILVFDEKKQLFKEGYHILIPNLYLPKYLRKKILEELKERNDDIDINSYAVPNLFYGNIKKTDNNIGNKYKINHSIEYIIKDNKIKNKQENDEELFCMTYAAAYAKHPPKTYHNEILIKFIKNI